MQKIKLSTINYIHITDGGDKNIKRKGKRCKVHGVWYMTWVLLFCNIQVMFWVEFETSKGR